MKKTIIVILATVMISSLMAQPRTNRTPRNHKPMGVVGMKHNMDHPGPQGFGQPSERMEMMMTWKLTEELELTPEQADKFFPRMKAHRDNIEKIDTEIREVVRDMRDKIKDDEDILDKEFNSFYNQVIDLEKQKIDEKNRFMTEMKGILENSQRAKLAMFKDRFAKDMQEQIRAKRKAMAK
ncbi:MAG: periplasmic heavy metal sensor [Candidatus Marinimicrobia bacterium]|nr:periplasmic heavy metal sensor [Candidatus Neomarinimicrobiota bacterium]